MLERRKSPLIIRLSKSLFYSIYNPLKILYWFVFRPRRTGVKVLVFNKGRILLVRIGYLHRQWIIPGGAVDRGEKIEEAALRELKEESGLELYKVISLVTRLYVTQYKRDTVHYFFAHSSIEDLSIDGQEIIDAGWFSLDNLPSDRKKRMDEVIQLYLKENT